MDKGLHRLKSLNPSSIFAFNLRSISKGRSVPHRDLPETNLTIDAVIFDLDGTLVDSAGDLTAALVEFLRPWGFPDFSDSDVKRWMGTDADDIISGLMADFSADPGSGFDLAVVARSFLDFYDTYPHHNSVVFAGAMDLLEELNSRNIRIGICTNKRSILSRAILDDLGLLPWIGSIAGSDTTAHKKPHPAPLLHVLAELGVTPDKAVMVGDSISDVRVGRAAGVALVVGADYGYPRRPEDLHGADRRIAALRDLGEVLRGVGV